MKNKIKDKLAELQFWWAKKTIKDGRDFELSVDELGTLVTLLRGQYAGVQFRFGPMTLRESNEAMLDFSTVVVYNPKNVDVLNKNFEKLSSNILRFLLAEAVEDTKYPTDWMAAIKVIDENRKIDTIELDQERGFYEESTPVLEKRVSKRKPRKKVISTDSRIHPEVQQPAKPKRTRARTTGKKRPHRK